MAAQRLARQHQRILPWFAANSQRTRGVLTSSPQDVVRALPGDKRHIGQSLQTLEARGLLAIHRSPGGKAEALWLTPEGQTWASQLAGRCDEGESDVAAMGCSGGKGLSITPPPVSAGGSAKMTAKARQGVRNVSSPT